MWPQSLFKSVFENKREQRAFFRRLSLCLNEVNAAATQKQSPSVGCGDKYKIRWERVHCEHSSCRLNILKVTMYIAFNFEGIEMLSNSAHSVYLMNKWLSWIEPWRLEFDCGDISIAVSTYDLDFSIKFRAISRIWNAEIHNKIWTVNKNTICFKKLN